MTEQIRNWQNSDNTRDTPFQNSPYLFDLWFLMAGRIAPQLCCINPPPLYHAFQAALREVSRQEGDIDLAVQYLHDIVAIASPEGMVFQQAGQLLNIIEWRRTYHKQWFSSNMKRRRMKPGKCGPYIARTMALFQAAADEEALDLSGKIIEKSDSDSDDRRLAHLIRVAILICTGEIEAGEDELRHIDNLTAPE